MTPPHTSLSLTEQKPLVPPRRISKAEFASMYEALKKHTQEEQEQRATLVEQNRRAKRRAQVLCIVIGLLVTLVAILLGGNAALSYYVAESTKESHVEGSAAFLQETV
jgi:cell division septal protein FtsQ